MTRSMAEQPRPQAEANAFLLLITGVTAIAGFLYGYDTGIISGALLHMTEEFGLGHRMQEVIAASILVGAVIGALACGAISERIGRRRTVLLVAVVFLIGAAASAMSGSATALAISRVFLGLAVGGSSQIVPVYIAELAPAARRGRLVISFNLAIGIGILVANIVGFTLHDIWSWRTMIAVAILPALLLLLGMVRLPESPRWLVEQNRAPEARAVLDRLRATDMEALGEMREIEDVVRASQGGGKAGFRQLWRPWVRPATVAALGVAAFTQFSGLEMMIYYTPTILANAGFGNSAALMASVGLAAMFVLMTAVGRVIVDRVGRRRLMLVMIPGSVVSLAVLGSLFHAGVAEGPYAWTIVAALLVFMVFNAGGIQVVGWLLGAEMFPLAIRGRAASAHAATLWGSNLIVTSTALTMASTFGTGGLMWFYGLLNAIAFLFVLKCVPETAGRSLEQIENALRAGTFRPGVRQDRAPAGRPLEAAGR
jgi:sugar porter (SP) family MFS transporter